MSAYSDWHAGFMARHAATRRSDNRYTERLGQAAFNHLHETYPELADEIRGTDDDPYYNDGKIAEFCGLVAARLERPA